MHAIISEADFRRELDATAGKAYLFFGEEDYLKNHAVKQLRERICPEEAFAVFNDVTLDAIDYTPDALLGAMSAPPMMTEGKLIVVRGLDFTAMRAGELDALCETLALLSEYDYNTVVIHVAAGLIDEGRLPKSPSTVLKKLAEVAHPVRFEAVSEGRLAAWAGKHFAHLGVRVSPQDAAFLVAYVGRSMFRLASEIEKIAYFVLAAGRNEATETDMREVAVAAVEADAFALSNAISAGRYREALDALAVMKFERLAPTIVMGELSRTLCDMYATRFMLDAGKNNTEVAELLHLHSYKAGLLCRAVARTPLARLARAVELCTLADAALKRASNDYAAIEQLICSL